MVGEMISMAQILMGFLVGFVLGCLAADLALKKKTGAGIQFHLAMGKKNSFPGLPGDH